MKYFLSAAMTRFAIVAMLCSLSWSAYALADNFAKYPIAIPAQNLASALQELSKQSRTNLIYRPEQVRGFRTRGIVGTFSAKQAANKLIEGTPLTVSVDTTGALLIAAPIPSAARAQASPIADARKEGKSNSSPGFRVAQLAQGAATGADSMKSTTQHSDSEESPALQEIIVTAQKYRQRAFDVPISLQVVEGNTLVAYGITDLSDLQYDVPGLYMNNTGTEHAVYLRGVGNTFGSGAMVGQYIDEADVTAEGFTGGGGDATDDNALYDLQRVEVLKGPQGTLYGDGSIGGVIRYITNKPVLDRFQTNTDVAALFTEDGAPSQRVSTMLNAPLVTGALGLRVAGLFENDGGWVDEPAANLKNVNGSDLADVRAEALWQPAARLKLNLTQTIHRHTYGIGNGEDANGDFTPLFDTTLVQNGADSSNMSNATLTFDTDSARLVSSSTYLKEVEDVHNSFNTFSENGILYADLLPYSRASNEDFSEELRLANTGQGPWEWTVGSFYKHFRDAYFYPLIDLGLATSPLALTSKIPVENLGESSNSLAGFADTSYRLFERLTLGAGLRYFTNHQISNLTRLSSGLTTRQAATFPSTDPRFYMQYRVTPRINTYASASKGFRSGGFNSPPSSPYQPETLWSYDVGSKIRFPEEGLAADVDVFYMNYSKFVTVANVPPLYPDQNVGNARIKGVDADLTWQPLDSWRTSVTTEILNTEFLTATALSGYAPGNRLPFAPEYSFTASVQHSYRWNDKPGDVEVYYYETSGVQDRPPLAQSDVLHFLNARVELRWSEALRFGVFAHNLLNDRGNVSPEYISDNSVRPRPRTFGVEFTTSVP